MTDVVCSACGRPPREGESLLTWMADTDASGGRSWVCDSCARENVRAIEAKLDRQWW